MRMLLLWVLLLLLWVLPPVPDLRYPPVIYPSPSYRNLKLFALLQSSISLMFPSIKSRRITAFLHCTSMSRTAGQEIHRNKRLPHIASITHGSKQNFDELVPVDFRDEELFCSTANKIVLPHCRDRRAVNSISAQALTAARINSRNRKFDRISDSVLGGDFRDRVVTANPSEINANAGFVLCSPNSQPSGF
ncbi:hypothetical protein B0H16DRAFT_1762938 [Mycena metata]|uniref:Uncharacterized protein n=1 Tax=Mycena metata TaxID=1033252 RepID=A0AAD7I7H8_9AGAR|nr:hypothetical protein B0H16DRAFT_1762938 [Mycena metata]